MEQTENILSAMKEDLELRQEVIAMLSRDYSHELFGQWASGPGSSPAGMIPEERLTDNCSCTQLENPVFTAKSNR